MPCARAPLPATSTANPAAGNGVPMLKSTPPSSARPTAWPAAVPTIT